MFIKWKHPSVQITNKINVNYSYFYDKLSYWDRIQYNANELEKFLCLLNVHHLLTES